MIPLIAVSMIATYGPACVVFCGDRDYWFVGVFCCFTLASLAFSAIISTKAFTQGLLLGALLTIPILALNVS
ncbi:MAG: hypothetical protein VXX54_00505 [Candidatus Thermoplasmatota archaeon]|nr:hypothetical protein [Candidatus Thermoplasmatota archaeon]